jgi:hypothetical protein
VVSVIEAIRRKSLDLPVVDRAGPEGWKYLFCLHAGDMVSMDDSEGTERLFIVRGMSEFTNGTIQLAFLEHKEARPITKVPKEGRTKTPDKMRAASLKKLFVTPLGELRRAND